MKINNKQHITKDGIIKNNPVRFNTSRIDEEVNTSIEKAKLKKKYRDLFVDSANKYYRLIMPLLKKRGIKVKSTQIYFNITPNYPAALAHIDFVDMFGDYDSIKVKNLERELKQLKVPMPVGSPSRGITITLYEDTLYENYVNKANW